MPGSLGFQAQRPEPCRLLAATGPLESEVSSWIHLSCPRAFFSSERQSKASGRPDLPKAQIVPSEKRRAGSSKR